METSPSYCRHLRFLRFQKLKLFWPKISWGIYRFLFTHTLFTPGVSWTTKNCTEAVNMACLVDGFSAGLTPSMVTEREANVLHGGLALTTPGAEAPPASSEPGPGVLLSLETLGGVWGRQTLHFLFWSWATGQWHVARFGLVVSLLTGLQNWALPGHEDLVLLSSWWQRFRRQWSGESPGPVLL